MDVQLKKSDKTKVMIKNQAIYNVRKFGMLPGTGSTVKKRQKHLRYRSWGTHHLLSENEQIVASNIVNAQF